MKPLLTTILLLLCSLAWGQNDTLHIPYFISDGVWNIGEFGVYDNSKSFPKFDPYSPMTIITLDMLLDYSKECYNDSTYEEYTIVSFDGEPAKITQHPISKYTHKQPTFAGFIEWLERKYLEE